MKRDPIHILKENWNHFLECGSIFYLENNHYIIGWGKRVWTESEGSGPFFYFPDFFLSNSTPWFQHPYTLIVSGTELLSELSKQKQLKNEWNQPSFAQFEETFKEIKKIFDLGMLKKAVPYVFTEADLSFNTVQVQASLQKSLLYASENPVHIYGFWDENEGIFGASPEILFNYTKQEGVLETVALAGTKSHTDPNHLMNDEKELLEHRLVIEGIYQSLSHLGTVIREQTQILNLPNLSHLKTPIRLKTAHPMDFRSMVKALHPTPALGAFPKQEGWKWLYAYEQKLPRQRYGAPIGYVDETFAKCIVGIRNVQWEKKRARIGAGCGVVPESSLTKEWQEIHLKILSIKEMLSL